MQWEVKITHKAWKNAQALNESVLLVFQLLIESLKDKGPIPGRHWRNYSKLRGRRNEDKRHCHLVTGKPTYVCCWEVVNKKKRMIEVYYVGTHEKAPY